MCKFCDISLRKAEEYTLESRSEPGPRPSEKATLEF